MDFVSIKRVVTFVKNVNVGWKGNVKVIKVGPTYVVTEPTIARESKKFRIRTIFKDL